MKKLSIITFILALILFALVIGSSTVHAQANIRTSRINIGVGTGTTTLSSNATSTFGAGIRASSTALTGNTQGNGPFLVIGDTATTTIYGNTATSTFAAGASFAGGGIFSTNGLAITGGSLLITSTASSTLSGGLVVVGLRSTAGIVNTVGSINNEGTATSTWAGGLQLTGSANVCNASGTCLSSLTAITSLNGLTGTVQTFTAQGPLLIGSSGTVHTFTASSSPTFGELRATTSLAVATTTLGSEFILGVHGNSLLAGSTTVRGLLATSTVETLQLRVSGTATTTFAGGLSVTGLTSTGHGLFSGRGGFGTTTMAAVLGIQGDSVPLLMVASSTAGVSTGRNALVVDSKGFVGIGGTSTPQVALSIVGAAYTQEYVIPYAATMDVDWSKSNQQKVTLTGAGTFVFRNGYPGGAFRLVTCQDGTGSRLVTWPSTTTVSWIGYDTPGIATTQKDRCDVFSFIMTGATSSPKYVGNANNDF